MIGILAQERVLGATLGAALTGFVVFDQHRLVLKSISHSDSQITNQPQVKEAIFGKKSRSEFAVMWNKVVDKTFQPIMSAVSSRGWQHYKIPASEAYLYEGTY
ncbi:hypothetical protein ACFE04_011513 [Oxalis oulophora]